MIPATANFITANDNANPAKDPIIAMEIAGYARVFTTKDTGVAGHYPWLVEMGDAMADASDLEGSATLSDISVTVLDFGQAVTADLASAVLEGRVVTLKTGFVGLAYADFMTFFTGVLMAIPMGDSTNTYVFVLHDPRQDATQVIYTTGDDGQTIGSDHPRTVQGHPLDIMLDVLGTQLALAGTAYDSTKIAAYRDGPFAGMWMKFTLTNSVDALDFLQRQIMKPLGGYLRTTWDGKITPQFFQPLPGTNTPVATLDDSNIVSIPVPQQADLVNAVTVRFDQSGSEYQNEAVNVDSASQAKYGQQGQQIIESDGMRSGFQAFAIAAETAQAIFGRYGDKNPTFGNSSAGGGQPIEALWSACRIEQGDLVYVTHPLVPDRTTGTVGWVNKVFEVLKRNYKFSGNQFTVELTLVDGSFAASGGKFKITADAEPAWTGASAGDKATLMFISDATGKYSDGAAGNTFS